MSCSAADAAPVPGGSPTAAGEAAGEEGPHFRQQISLEDADATVETLLLMEYADLGTLDRRIVQGRLKGDLVRRPEPKQQVLGCKLVLMVAEQ